MKCKATLDFTGIKNNFESFKKGFIYDFEDNEETALLLKVGYLKKVEEVEVKEVKEVKEIIETKELKVKKQTKKKNG
jgi:hypothetical protein